MRYTSALVLSTMAVGQAAASSHGHAGFHARRSAQVKRGAEAVNWDAVAYDLSGVDWSTVDYSGGKSSAKPDAPAASSPPAVQQSQPAQSQPETTPAAAAPPSSTVAAAQPSKSAASSQGSGSTGGVIGDLTSELTTGLDAFAKQLEGIVINSDANQKSKNPSGLWIGDDSAFKATFTNDLDSTIAIICWRDPFMWINATPPPIFVTIGSGKAVTISIDDGFSGGCGAASSDSGMSMGQLDETILEFTTNKEGGKGCFDVSREINMKGLTMSAKGGRCLSGLDGDQLSCTFVCTNGNQKCGEAGEYGVALGTSNNVDCMGPGSQDGGCQMTVGGDHMQVTISGSRQWPEAQVN